jgi:hypothetical protein
MTDLTTMARDAVAALAPMLAVATDAGVKELGKSAVASVVDAFKRKFGAAGPAKAAVDDLVQNPTDTDMQAALRVQLRKLLEADPVLVQDLQDWLAKAKKETQSAGITQTANTRGNHNTVIQITGSGHTVQR